MSSFVELADAPLDIISSIKFSPVYNHLLVGSWDNKVNLYATDVASTQSHKGVLVNIDTDAAVTDVSWDDFSGKRAFMADVDGYIKEIDLENGKAVDQIGQQHELGVQVLKSIPRSNGILVSGSWDKTLQYIDSRLPGGSTTAHITRLPEKCFALDTTDKTVVVAMANRLVHIYDSRNLDEPIQIRESGLKYQTRSLKCMPDATGYAQSSIEGRVAIEYIDPSPKVQAEKYAFKCHRLSLSDVDLVSPVNSLTFHKKFGTLFTAGSDCHVCLWDQKSKKRLRQYPKFNQAVVCLDFDYKDGQSILAVATSDDSFKTMPSQTSTPPVPNRSSIFLKYLASSEGAPKR